LATQIQIKRGSTTPAGLTVGEKAVNTSTNQIYIGGTGGTVWVGGEVTGGVDMGAGSAVSATRVPTQSGVYNYVRNNFVTSFNGATGAVTGVCAAAAGTGISVSGSTGTVTITNIGVQSFNGLTGAVGGVTTSVANTFTALQTFTPGISAAGVTTGNLAVNSGIITTTATTAYLYNRNATSVVVGSSASDIQLATGSTVGITLSVGSYHKFKTNRVSLGTTAQSEIFRFEYINGATSAQPGADAAYAEVIVTAERRSVADATQTGAAQITKMLIAANPVDNSVFHVEYGNTNTNGNVASYTVGTDGTNVILYATPASNRTTWFKTFATLIKGEFGGTAVSPPP
jgi:hypothetical protein